MCVHHYASACFVSQRRSGYSICRANQNDLVGSEMCHKAALMDEGEHGANDTAASTRRHSRLMKAPRYGDGGFFFFLLKGKGARVNMGNLQTVS